ncbi:periplasmic nitrate reductase, NapE protein [Kaistia granuli]|uniref:periplasmic nitrate reductase, NapE protein n=1 Tax=Kaistia granuli TaxID=363259 RepID=UPI000380A054|nr:periplasmic nitrate reductase, NapE protein [Kaistia granuli]
MSDVEARRPVSARTKRDEIIAFLILAVVIWPVIAVGVVGGYGFLIWMSQLVFGPPGAPP